MAKTLKTKEEIVNAFNSNKYPVLTIDFAKNATDLCGEIVGFESSIAKIACTSRYGETYYKKVNLTWYRDEKKFAFEQGPAILSKGFGYYDIMDKVELANAPIVGANQEFMVVLCNSKTNKVFTPFILRTGAKIDNLCSTMLGVESEEQIDLLDFYKKSFE